MEGVQGQESVRTSAGSSSTLPEESAVDIRKAFGSFHVKSTRKIDTRHRFCRNLLSTYLTLSDELAWNFSP